jgi:hypothetical protein
LTRFKYSIITKIIAIILCFLAINSAIIFLALMKEYGAPSGNRAFTETDYFQDYASDVSQRIISNITNEHPGIRANFSKEMGKYINLKYYIQDNGSIVTNVTDTTSAELIRNNFQKAEYNLICDNDFGLVFENGSAWYDQNLRSWIRNAPGNKLYLSVTGDIVKGDEFYDALTIYKNRQSIFKSSIFKIE